MFCTFECFLSKVWGSFCVRVNFSFGGSLLNMFPFFFAQDYWFQQSNRFLVHAWKEISPCLKGYFVRHINRSSVNPTKCLKTLKQYDCLSVFDHLVGLALKGLMCQSNLTIVICSFFDHQSSIVVFLCLECEYKSSVIPSRHLLVQSQQWKRQNNM